MELFEKLGTVLTDFSKAQKSIENISETAEVFNIKLGDGVKMAATWGLGIANAAISVGQAMFSATEKVANVADEIDKAASQAGTDAGTWQKLSYAMSQNRISAETLEKSMLQNQKALNEAGNGVSAYADIYKALGIEIKNVDDSMRSSDAVYQDTLKSLADLEDIGQRNILANQLFGESYSDLGRILDSGSEGIDNLTSRAEELGLVLSQEAVDAGVQFGDTLSDVKQIGDGIFNMIASELLPIVQVFLDFIIKKAPEIQEVVGSVAEFIRDVISSFKKFWDEHGEAIMMVVESVFDAIAIIINTALDVIRGIIEYWTSIMSGDWESAWEAVKGIFLTVWEGIISLIDVFLDMIITAILNIGIKLFNSAMEAFVNIKEGFSKSWDAVKEWFEKAKEEPVTAILSIGDSLHDAGKAVFERLWDGLKEKWEDIKSWFSDKLDFLNKETGLDGKGSASGRPAAAGLPYVPYDGYTAILHRGERVVNAEDNKTYGQTQQVPTGNTFVFNAPNPLTPAEARRQMQKGWKEIALGF